jgi:(4S)-4-hydroxy-5-phosphonooxypentane-2,3-dione isomerase
MSEFTVLGTVEFVAGSREQLLAALTAHRARSLAEEAGTLEFEILVPQDKEATIYTYEVYTDDEAFEAHLKGASFARIAQEAAEIITGLKINRVTTEIKV